MLIAILIITTINTVFFSLAVTTNIYDEKKESVKKALKKATKEQLQAEIDKRI